MSKPYRSIIFNDERKWKSKHPLDDILQVGIQKAVGYICNSDESDEYDLEMLEKILSKKGKLTYIRDADNYDVLYIGDKDMMQVILDKNKNILIEAGLTTDPIVVFNKICQDDVDHDDNKELYHLICDLFNSWCLFCEVTIWTDVMKEPFSVHPKEPLSEHPYDPDQNNG